MTCLDCGQTMNRCSVAGPRGGLTYDLCPNCGSLWLDAGELDRMAYQVAGSIEASTAEPLDGSEAAAKPCPRCDNAQLEPVRFLDCTDIKLRRCPSCHGFWLDGGQLAQINQELAADMPIKGHGFSDFVVNVHAPYWSKRVQVQSSAGEPRLEAMPIPEARRVGETQHACPACGTPLSAYEAVHLRFEGCHACKGVWLPPGELVELKNKLSEGNVRWLNDEIYDLDRAAAIATARVCPVDGSKLMAVVFGASKLVLDHCPRCHGLWLDRGEFGEITHYLEQELGSMHGSEVRDKLWEEIGRLRHGGPEPRGRQLADIKATLPALIYAAFLDHPRLLSLYANVLHAGAGLAGPTVPRRQE